MCELWVGLTNLVCLVCLLFFSFFVGCFSMFYSCVVVMLLYTKYYYFDPGIWNHSLCAILCQFKTNQTVSVLYVFSLCHLFCLTYLVREMERKLCSTVVGRFKLIRSWVFHFYQWIGKSNVFVLLFFIGWLKTRICAYNKMPNHFTN